MSIVVISFIIFAVQHYKEIFGRKGGYDDLEAKTAVPRRPSIPANTTVIKKCAIDGCEKNRIGGVGAKGNRLVLAICYQLFTLYGRINSFLNNSRLIVFILYLSSQLLS